MVRPNFLIVGAMKAGTTWLSYNLKNHPQVFIHREELHFFNNPQNLNRGLSWYESHFAEGKGAIAIGEKTAGYLLDPQAPERILKSLPGVRILIVLRNPVERAISQINHHIRYGSVPPDLSTDHLLDSDAFHKIDYKYSILQRGHYFEQVERYYRFFGPKRISILINETDIRQDPKLTLRKTCQFLEIEPDFDFPSKDKKIHENRNSRLGVRLAYSVPSLRPLVTKIDRYLPGAKVPPFSPSEPQVEKLYEIYASSNRQLFDSLDREQPASWRYATRKDALLEPKAGAVPK